jgi:hypothetical protein
MSFLNAFNTQLIRFFEELCETYPEEKDLKMGLEALVGLKKINPKMILTLFNQYVYTPLADPIAREDEDVVIAYAKRVIDNEFNEMSVALLIFNKYWGDMAESNKKAIWKYLKVLCALCEKAKA